MEMKLKNLTTARWSAMQQLDDIQANERKLTAEVDKANNRRLEHRRFRPGFLEILFSFGRAFYGWRGKDKEIKRNQCQKGRKSACQAKRGLPEVPIR